MPETLGERAARIYDENGLGTALFLYRRQLREGVRTRDDVDDDLFRAACAEERAREWKSIHPPTALEERQRARSLFVAYFAKVK